MFGYIVINQQELKIKDYEKYRGYYCGVCHSLKERYGKIGQSTLSYDMTFLSILLNGLYEVHEKDEQHICLVHPAKKHRMIFNQISDYVADMGILLSYYNLLDDWQDDRSLKSLGIAKLLKRHIKRIKKEYPRQVKSVQHYVSHLNLVERQDASSIDQAAGLTGTMLAEVFVMKEDEWSEELRKLGFFLGKFIYLMDAYEDIDKDIKSGSYNPWVKELQRPDFEDYAYKILQMMMTECAKTFELLPILTNAEIIRNILFAGVWYRYEVIKEKRNQ